MRGCYDDNHAGLADLQTPHAMRNCHACGSETLFSLSHNRTYLGSRHLRIDFVFQVAHLLATRIVAHYALKHYNTANSRMSYCGHERVAIELFVCNEYYRFHSGLICKLLTTT